ncbi:MAG: hypothetical protein Q4C87_01730 [Actinomycetaceae bacterium]|nr:hypothetical protein [Actinomycetaceae bacterium]
MTYHFQMTSRGFPHCPDLITQWQENGWPWPPETGRIHDEARGYWAVSRYIPLSLCYLFSEEGADKPPSEKAIQDDINKTIHWQLDIFYWLLQHSSLSPTGTCFSIIDCESDSPTPGSMKLLDSCNFKARSYSSYPLHDTWWQHFHFGTLSPTRETLLPILYSISEDNLEGITLTSEGLDWLCIFHSGGADILFTSATQRNLAISAFPDRLSAR